MFVFDQLKREDPALRLVAFGVLGALLILLAGLWWTQIVCYRDYQSDLNTQSFRSVRVPAPRGKITDRNGIELANNQPVYNVSLYLEELRGPFQAEFSKRLAAAKAALKAQRLATEQRLDRKLKKEELRLFSVSYSNRIAMGEAGRFAVASNLAAQVGAQVQVPIQLDPEDFGKHYAKRLALPYPILKELAPAQVARFEERFAGVPGLALDVQSKRVYPSNHLAAHAIGYLRRDDDSKEGDAAYFSYYLPDYRGLIGVEGGLDAELRGQAGGKSVLVNNLGYRQEESFWQPTVPGDNVVLTLDARLQRAAERALLESGGNNTRGAVVVMDVRNGDILALASSPTYNPNYYVTGFPPGDWARMRDEELKPEFNRSTQDIYQPGSIFKIVVGMAALERGVNPNEIVEVPPHPDIPTKGAYYIGRSPRKDQAGPGRYKFREAFARSSNAVFVDYARRPGVLEKVVELGHKLHLGERAGVPTRQESAGIFPASERIRSGWSSGDTANLAIGQSQLAVTPLQMAVMISAVANGGTVYWPRLVQRLESQDPLNPVATQTFEAKRVRDRLGVSSRTLSIVHDAMLADTEDPDGTGRGAVVPGFRVGGKTGTAQVGDIRNRIVDQITWFASYGPWEKPRYAVIVMVESGQSGGTTCAPIARKVYETIKQIEQPGVPVAALNRN
jgi:penicillin-binding protein 2